jgi:hypothetical protein
LCGFVTTIILYALIIVFGISRYDSLLSQNKASLGVNFQEQFYNEADQLISNFSDSNNIGFNLMFRVANSKGGLLPD